MALGWEVATASLAWPDTTQATETSQLPTGPLQPQDASADNSKQIRIGVLAKRGRAHCLYQWGPTAAYLSEQIPEISFSILPLDFNQIFNAVQKQTVDFIFANPSFYVELEVRFGVTRIAALNNLHSDKAAHAVFAGQIRTIRPEIPIIICTGFSDQINEEKCKALGIQGLVKKPVITQKMATAIRAALEDPTQPDKMMN